MERKERRSTMQEVSMKLGLLELFQLVGIDKGISFYYEELPGVVVTIGFIKEESNSEESNNEMSMH
jgi:hypothetical protein